MINKLPYSNMSESSMKEELNALLKKSDGDIENLTGDELYKLQYLTTRMIVKDLNNTYANKYKDLGCIAAFLREEIYKRRISQEQLAKMLNVSYHHLSRVLNGHSPVRMSLVIAMYRFFEIDANFILENV